MGGPGEPADNGKEDPAMASETEHDHPGRRRTRLHQHHPEETLAQDRRLQHDRKVLGGSRRRHQRLHEETVEDADFRTVEDKIVGCVGSDHVMIMDLY